MLVKWIWKSQDARVIADLNTIGKAMQVQYTYNGKYPMPDNYTGVSWASWELLWYQWTLWKKAISSIDKLTKVPEDPTKANPKEWYDYSVTKDQQTYQVFGFISDKKYAIGNSYLNETNADKKQYYITSVGNYNGYVIGVTGNKYVIYATPSLYILTWDYWIYSLNSPYKNYFYKIWKKVSDLMKKWEKIPYVDITELVQNPENTIELNTIANSFKIQKISKLVSAINNAGNNKWWKIVKIKPSWWGIIIQNTGTVCDAETWSLHNYWLSVEKNATYSWKNYDKIIYLSGDENLACMYKALHDKENFWKGIAFVLESDIDFTYLSWHYSELNKTLNLSYYVNWWNTFLPIWGHSYERWSHPAWWSTSFNADFYGNKHQIKVWNINYPNHDEVWFFGWIWNDLASIHNTIYGLKIIINSISWNHWVWGFVWWNDYHWQISNSSVVVNSISWNDSDVWGFVWYNGWQINNSSVVVNSISWNDGDVWGFVWRNDYHWQIKNSSVVVNSISWNYYVWGFVWDNGWQINNSSVVINSINWDVGFVWGFVWYNGWQINNSSAVVNSISWNRSVWGFVWWNDNWTISNSSIVVNSINWNGNYVWGFVWYNDWPISNSSVVVNSISWTGDDVWGFVWENDWTISNSSSRVLVLNGASSDVSADYYNYDGNDNISTGVNNIPLGFNKQEFFFGDNLTGSSYDWLTYDWTGNTLTITQPTSKVFNAWNFPDAFDSSNGNWWNTILTNLNNFFWTNW